MQYEVQIITGNGQPVRAKYGNKDVSGPGINNDPIIAEALKVWEDGVEVVEVTTTATVLKVSEAVEESDEAAEEAVEGDESAETEDAEAA